MSLDTSKSLSAHGLGSDHAHHSGHADLNSPGVIERLTQFQLAPSVRQTALMLIIIGGVTLIGSLFIQPQLLWASILLVSFMLVSLALAGVFLIAVQFLTGAGWSIVLRRICEGLTGLLIPGLIGIAAVLILRPSLYPWTQPVLGEHGFTGFKGLWLNHTYWLIRAAIYAVVWLFFTYSLRWHSRQQDVDGKLSHTKWSIVLSAMYVIAFALTYWLASVDWLMSLEPHWFSTMYGVYNFAGMFSSGVACVIVLAVWLRNRGTLQGIISDDHLHDLGKMLMAFTTFWAYIWFSEYMLIWYANIPEETGHFAIRTQNLWMPLFYLNLGLNWLIPFLALLPRAAKRDGNFLMKIALIVLVGRVLDLYLLIIPSVSESTPLAGIAPLGIVLGGLGVFILVFGRTLGSAPLIPLKDPYLNESLNHHV